MRCFDTSGGRAMRNVLSVPSRNCVTLKRISGIPDADGDSSAISSIPAAPSSMKMLSTKLPPLSCNREPPRLYSRAYSAAGCPGIHGSICGRDAA